MISTDDINQVSDITAVLSSFLSVLDTSFFANVKTISEVPNHVMDILSLSVLSENIPGNLQMLAENIPGDLQKLTDNYPGDTSVTTIATAAASIDLGAIFSKAASTGKAGK